MSKQTNSDRLNAAKVSCREALKHHSDDVMRNSPKYYGMGIFAHAEFLARCVEKLTGGDKGKLNALSIDTEDLDLDAPATSAAA